MVSVVSSIPTGGNFIFVGNFLKPLDVNSGLTLEENWELGTNKSAALQPYSLYLQRCETVALIGLFARDFVVLI